MLSRLIYVSENRIDPAEGSPLSQLNAILDASRRNNARQGITGALVFDGDWFVQALEGERRAVWATFERIAADERHGGTQLIEMVDVPERIFGNWWMGLATRTEATAWLFHPRGGGFAPAGMSARQLVELMVAVSKLGLRREVASRAA